MLSLCSFLIVKKKKFTVSQINSHSTSAGTCGHGLGVKDVSHPVSMFSAEAKQVTLGMGAQNSCWKEPFCSTFWGYDLQKKFLIGPFV